jgi:hypothetical protein
MQGSWGELKDCSMWLRNLTQAVSSIVVAEGVCWNRQAQGNAPEIMQITRYSRRQVLAALGAISDRPRLAAAEA